jgi:hypothetical protein
MDIVKQFAEVVETTNSDFLAQCYELDGVPALGSLVRTSGKDCRIYAVVYSSGTHSIEPGRRIVARGRDAESPEAIFRENPQLARLLCSDFRALVAGHEHDEVVYQYLPPAPAPVYAFVYQCSLKEVGQFTSSLDFLSLMLDSRLPVASDEVIAAFLRYASRAQSDPPEFLVRAGKELAWLLSSDIRRLDSILKRLRP